MIGLAPTRLERAAEAAELRARGLTQQQIADMMRVSRSYVADLLADPADHRGRERKRGYGRPCERCGKMTDGSNGRAKAPRLCAACTNAARAPGHGTLSRYQGGCRCDACREANTEAGRALRAARRTPPTHGVSGYLNYACRCDVCRRAHSERMRAQREHNRLVRGVSR